MYFAVLDQGIMGVIQGQPCGWIQSRHQTKNVFKFCRRLDGGSVEVRRCARTILLGVADEDVVHNDVTANVETQDSLIDWRE
jgi:hypothetical protein